MQLIQICRLRLNYIYQNLTLLVIFSIYIPLLIIYCRFIGFLGGYVVHSSSLKSVLLVDFCDEKYN